MSESAICTRYEYLLCYNCIKENNGDGNKNILCTKCQIFHILPCIVQNKYQIISNDGRKDYHINTNDQQWGTTKKAV